MSERDKRATAPIDPDVALIERYHAALIQDGEDRIAATVPPLDAAEAARQRAETQRLAGAIRAGHLADLRERRART